MPDVSDPSFAREQRRAAARRAAAEATPERQQELRSKYAPPPAPPRERRAASGTRSRRKDDEPTIDVTAVAASAAAALDTHPSTWTSYAELCAASGLDRNLASAVARQLVPQPTGDHWCRIRDSDGVYHGPRAGSGRPVGQSQADADRALEEIGVRVRAHRADPERKLLWMHGEWCLAGR